MLIVGYVWPEPRSSAAGVRTESLIRAFQRAGWRVFFSSPSKENEHFHRTREAVERAEIIEANDPRFDAFVREVAPDIVVFDRFVIEEQFGWRVAAAAPGALRVIDTQDLHFLRRARAKAVESGELELMTDDAIREVSAIYRSDLSLLISDFELALLKGRFGVPGELLALHRFSFETVAETDSRLRHGTAFTERAGFCVIGNFRHPPNADGLRWFREAIWPLMHERLPGAQVHVYGAYPPKDAMRMDDPKAGFRVHGWVPDAREAIGRHRVNLAPLRFGAGIKGKIADGWAVGTPVVTTSIGAEGMRAGEPVSPDVPGTAGLPTSSELPLAAGLPGGADREFLGGAVADTPEGFAEAAVRLHENADEWARSSREGIDAFNRLFDRERNDAALIRSLLAARGELTERRARNFTGRMLNHHLHRSTEFFSRWIEVKTRLKGRD